MGRSSAPQRASALHTHVSRLRKTLGADTIARREWGYVLRAAPGDIDLRRFEGLVADAESLAARDRSLKLAEALALWRGPALADLVNEHALLEDIARLDEFRLNTLERRIDADLEAGQNGNLVVELEALIARHPLREHLRWLLILSLYRAGRQAEALEVYRETRRVLTEELGLEPSPALKELEQAILRQDPSLEAETAPTHAEPLAVEPGPERRRIPPVALLALLALGLAGTATAIALVRPENGTSSRTATEAIFETLTATTANPATDASRTTDGNKTSPTTSTAKNHTNPGATTTTNNVSSARPTTTVAQKAQKKHKQVAPPPKPVTISDNFSNLTLDPLVWNTGGGGSGASFKLANGQLIFSVAADATFDPQYHFAGSGIVTQCALPGNFDARVAFNLLQWPAANGARIDLTISQQGGAAAVELIQRVTAPGGDGYNAYPSGSGVTRLPDQSGSLRLTRAKGIVRAFFRHDSRWIKLGQKAFSGAISVGVDISAIQQDWQQQDVSATVENFVLKASSADCPAGSNP